MTEHTPEQLAQINQLFEKAKPLLDKFDKEKAEINDKWQAELGMLKRRVEQDHELVELSNGDKIAIRTCLNEKEGLRLEELEKIRNEAGRAGETEKVEDATFEIIALVTANPLITVEWLRENKDNYAVNDIVSVTFLFYEAAQLKMRERVDRVKRIANFRPE